MDASTEQTSRDRDVPRARRRASIIVAVAGLLVLPYFAFIQAVATFDPVQPPLGAPAGEFVDFYVDNYERLPLVVTLYVGQWVIVLVLLVALVRAATERLDLAAIVAVALAGAATAIYVAAEGVLVWPALPSSGTDAVTLAEQLDPALAQAALLPRDGLHAPASVLIGFAVLVIAWLLARSDLWGHWAMAGLGFVAGTWALSAVVVGPEGLGPGLVFVVWAPVVAVLLLVGLWRTRSSSLTAGPPPVHQASAEHEAPHGHP